MTEPDKDMLDQRRLNLFSTIGIHFHIKSSQNMISSAYGVILACLPF